MIMARTACKATVHHDPHTVDREAGLGNAGGQDDLAVRAFANCRTLFGWIDSAMQTMDFGRDAVEPFCSASNLSNAGKESQDIAALLGQGLTNGCSHPVLDPCVSPATNMFEGKRVGAPLTFERGRVHQGRKTLSIERG